MQAKRMTSLTKDVDSHVPLTTVSNGRLVEERDDPRVQVLVDEVDHAPAHCQCDSWCTSRDILQVVISLLKLVVEE